MSQTKHRIIFPALAAALSLVGFALLASLPEPSTRAAPDALVNVKLNGEMQPEGDVVDFPFALIRISPDSRYVVYAADAETDNAFELFSAPTTGGSPPVRLSGLLAAGTGVEIVGITPDSERVVYIAPQEKTGVNELFVVPIGGGLPQKLNAPLGTGANVWHAILSPDGSRVVYMVTQPVELGYQLFSVPTTGGPVSFLSDGDGLLIERDQRLRFRISPDGNRVVYALREFDNTLQEEVHELFSVPITGGQPAKLNAPLPAGGSVAFYDLSTSGRVVYRTWNFYQNQFILYSAPVGGGLVLPLTEPTDILGPYPESPGLADFKITPDGSRVIFLIDQDNKFVYELYSVPISGGAVVKINTPLTDQPGVNGNFQIAPDSSRVVFRVRVEGDVPPNLFSAPVAGGPNSILNGPITSNGSLQQFAISPDSDRVVYRADQQTELKYELYSVPITGGQFVKLNGSLVSNGDVIGFAISPDSDRVIYRADQQAYTKFELFSVPITGGQASRVNGRLVDGGDVIDFSFSPDGDRVIYQADQEVDWQDELFATFDDSLLPTPTPTATTTARPTATPTATATATTQPPVGDSRVYLPVMIR